MVDSLKGVENKYDGNVQAEQVVVRFALPLLLVGVVLRRRYSLVVRFGQTEVEGALERQGLRIHIVVLVPMFLSWIFSL